MAKLLLKTANNATTATPSVPMVAVLFARSKRTTSAQPLVKNVNQRSFVGIARLRVAKPATMEILLVGMAAQRHARRKQAIPVLREAVADPPFAVTAYESAVSNAMTRMA
jgi:hypothetical protein